jgi:cold shock CspA family protein
VLPFSEDTQLAHHLASQQPRPRRRPPAPPMTPAASSDRPTGTVAYFNGRFGFIVPDGADFHDRAKHLFVHGMALQRSGISDISLGTLVSYDITPSRHPGGKPEAQNVEIIAP